MKRPLISAVSIVLGLGFCAWITYYSWILSFSLFFYDGLLGILVLLLIAKLTWPRCLSLHLAANTVILLIVGLSLADGFWRFRTHQQRQRVLHGPLDDRIYSVEAARADPVQFRAWWERFAEEWWRIKELITMADPEDRLPFKLKPGSSATFFEDEYRINSLGFRDREFAVEKGDCYRIVAIGESTTMGITLKQGEKPWPKILEGMIEERLELSRRVEVINAGVAAYSLADNLIRLREDVLPLEPDMILAYHGYNGFQFLDNLDWVHPPRPPKPIERPSRFLADVEYKFKLRRFKHRYFRKGLSEEEFSRLRTQVYESPIAQLHRELISLTRAPGIKLALLSYNMAVNLESPFEVVNFYASAYPDASYRIQANRLQTHLLKQLAAAYPDLVFIDTSEGLDGVHERYIDLMHFTQRGRRRLAENVFHGIKESLLKDPKLKNESASRRSFDGYGRKAQAGW